LVNFHETTPDRLALPLMERQSINNREAAWYRVDGQPKRAFHQLFPAPLEAAR
jgi:hypothetical protein